MEKKEFLSGTSGFVIGKFGDYSFELENYDDNKIIERIRVRMRV